jgi:hypothetical protein
MCAYDHGKNPNSVQNQGSLGRKGQQTSSQGKRETVRDEKGCDVRRLTERHEVCARPHAPAPVKPCPGEQRSEQGFSGSPRYGTTTRPEYKGNKKRLQGNVFMGSIVEYNVTLLELLDEW